MSRIIYAFMKSNEGMQDKRLMAQYNKRRIGALKNKFPKTCKKSPKKVSI